MTPADGATGVATTASITLTFSKALDAHTVTAASVGVFSDHGWVAGVLAHSGDTVTFTPASALTAARQYKIYVASTLADAAGNTLGQTINKSFTTAAQLVIPTVLGHTPADASVAFPARITARFSGPLNPDTVNTARFSLSDGSNPPLAGSVAVVNDQAILTLRPDAVMLPGTSYTATVSHLIQDAGGTPLGGDVVWSFITPALRGTAQLIEADNTGNATAPAVVADTAGNALAVWQQFDGSYNSVYANYYKVGLGWQGRVLVATASAGDASGLQLAINPQSGDATAVWLQRTLTMSAGVVTAVGTQDLYAARFTAATQTWGAAASIESLAGDASSPRLLLDSSGAAVVAWLQDQGTYSRLYVKRYSGGSWVGEVALSTLTRDARDPALAADGAGHVLVLWAESDGSQYSVLANYYNGSAWGSTADVDQFADGDAAEPAVVFTGTGTATAVWQQQYASDGTNPRQTLHAGHLEAGSWSTVEVLEQADAGNVLGAVVTADGNGAVTAIWQQHDGLHWNLLACRRSAGQWGDVYQIENDDSGDALRPRLAHDSQGNIEVVWQQHDGLRWNIWSSSYSMTGDAWQAPTLLENDALRDSKGAARNAEQPAVAIDGDGNVTAVWQQHDGTRFNIWASRY
ncbi:MAG: Ig-like domain-containing protein [Gammaproteobacteria bacterium]|nr:Ig-like domain-containing protein [Gammaproteobacteria bacterium]